MKISEIISQLEQIKTQYGDLSGHIETHSSYSTSKPIKFPCVNINESSPDLEKIVIFI
jgi:hypothetical protein